MKKFGSAVPLLKNNKQQQTQYSQENVFVVSLLGFAISRQYFTNFFLMVFNILIRRFRNIITSGSHHLNSASGGTSSNAEIFVAKTKIWERVRSFYNF